jgi:hypothetical protein
MTSDYYHCWISSPRCSPIAPVAPAYSISFLHFVATVSAPSTAPTADNIGHHSSVTCQQRMSPDADHITCEKDRSAGGRASEISTLFMRTHRSRSSEVLPVVIWPSICRWMGQPFCLLQPCRYQERNEETMTHFPRPITQSRSRVAAHGQRRCDTRYRLHTQTTLN